MTSPQAVSKALRKAGWGIAADRKHFGILVTRATVGASVFAQFDSDEKSVQQATLAAEVLRKLGYTVQQRDTILNVSKEG